MPGLRDILNAATPGPWEVSDFEQDGGITYRHVYCEGTDLEVMYQTPADARLIALAPQLAALALDQNEGIRQDARREIDGYGLCWCPDNFYRKHDTAFSHLNRCVRNSALLARLDQLGKEQT